MMKEKREKQTMYGSIIAFGVSSASVLLFPVDRLLWIPGMLFWGGMIAGCVLQYLLVRRVSKYHCVAERKGQYPGMCRFFSNKEAAVADAIFLPAVVGFIITAHETHAIGYLGYVFLAVALFALCMHGVLNGRSYNYVRYGKMQKTGTKNFGRKEEQTDEE